MKDMGKIIELINGSDLFKRLNERCKNLYEQSSREPSEEEYQTLRNMLICKTMLEDEKLFQEISQQVWKANQN